MDEEKKLDCNSALEMIKGKIAEIREKVDNMRNEEGAFVGRFGARYYGYIEIKSTGEGLEELVNKLAEEYPEEFPEIRESEEFKSGLMKLVLNKFNYYISINDDYLEKAINYHRPSVLKDPYLNEAYEEKRNYHSPKSIEIWDKAKNAERDEKISELEKKRKERDALDAEIQAIEVGLGIGNKITEQSKE